MRARQKLCEQDQKARFCMSKRKISDGLFKQYDDDNESDPLPASQVPSFVNIDVIWYKREW
jgi:hypothetical protein